jgi:hypothetical protein
MYKEKYGQDQGGRSQGGRRQGEGAPAPRAAEGGKQGQRKPAQAGQGQRGGQRPQQGGARKPAAAAAPAKKPGFLDRIKGLFKGKKA